MRDEFYEAALSWAREHGFEGDKLPQGMRAVARCCPLAQATGMLVGPECAVKDMLGGGTAKHELPVAVRTFVRRFDRGDYPELIQRVA